MARRSEHSPQEIKEMVLSAAETIVIEDGLSALKVRKIAMEIGYTVGSIYMVFENMAELILHLKSRALDDLTNQLERVDDSHGDVKQHIIELAKTYLQFAQHNSNRWQMIFTHTDSTVTATPEWYRHQSLRMFEKVEQVFVGLLPETDCVQARSSARALWCGVHGVCQLSLTEANGLGDEEAENLVVVLVDNFLNGWSLGRRHE